MSYDYEEMQKLAEQFPGYGTGIHYPYCKLQNCTGCLPDMNWSGIKPPPQLDLSIFKRD